MVSAHLSAAAVAAVVAAVGVVGAHTDHWPTTAVRSYNAAYVNGYQQDVDPPGDSIGDSVVDLFALTTTGGRRAGSVPSQCTLVDPAAPLAQCTASLVLADGTVTLAGDTTGTADTTYAITGGTGHYRGARGVVRFHPTSSTVRVTVVFVR